jgi:crotonobetainyl-CoA:carnitine CoA-transferase CaiB-like acyl-CoA transferase
LGALDGIRILELSRVPPAGLCTMLLADMGADVLKVEMPPGAGGAWPERDASRAAFNFVNRNKRSLVLNLKAPQGQEVFRRLADRSDVIVEGFRPGVMKRLGGDYETVRATNPGIIYCSLSGFGQDGPYRDLPGHDLTYISLAGVLGLIGEPGRMPTIPLNLIADYGGASLHAALGIVLALFARERTGTGQYVDISYLDTAVSLLAAAPNLRFLFSDGIAAGRGEGFLGGTYPYYAVYEARDGRLLTIGCLEPRLWQNFCRAIGRPDLSRFGFAQDQFARSANSEEVWARQEIASIMKTRDRDEWFDFLARHDVCVGKVYDVKEVFRDPHVIHRRMLAEVEHPAVGWVRQVGIAIKLSDTPGEIRRLGPAPGEHTDEVLGELGLTPEEIGSLRRGGVVE